jgi:hypothetical protein
MSSFNSEFGDNMTAAEISAQLYSRITPWSRVQSAGVFLSAQNEATIEKAQNHLESFLMVPADAKDLVRLYITLANNCTYDLQVQQYVFTRFEEILDLGSSTSANSLVANGVKKGSNGTVVAMSYADLFVTKEGDLNDGVFIRALTNSDPYLQKCSARGLSTIYASISSDILPIPEPLQGALSIPLSPNGSTGNAGPALDSSGKVSNLSNLVYWIKNLLINAVQNTQKLEVVMPALTTLMRCAPARTLFVDANCVNITVNLISCLDVTGNPQHLYELCFVLWSVSLNVASGDKQATISAFSQGGAVYWLSELVAAAPTRKITRMALACLHNLAKAEDSDILTEIFATKLSRLVDTMMDNDSYKVQKDAELEGDIKGLSAVLERNFRELSTFERWATEVNSGSLRWGVVHTSKFWKDNYRFMEAEDWAMLKKLIACLDSGDSLTVSVALFDLGEFTRLYPSGRVITTKLGGKDKALKFVQSDDEDIQRQALQSVSKIMIGWDASSA